MTDVATLASGEFFSIPSLFLPRRSAGGRLCFLPKLVPRRLPWWWTNGTYDCCP